MSRAKLKDRRNTVVLQRQTASIRQHPVKRADTPRRISKRDEGQLASSPESGNIARYVV